MNLRFPALLTGLCLSLASVSFGIEVQLVSTPALNSDGSEVLFSWRGDIWRVPIGGGQIQRLTTNIGQETNPIWSRDDKAFYYSSNKTGANQVYKMQIAGSRPVQLTFHSEGSIPIGLSPDGERVHISGQRDAWWRWANRFFSISGVQPQSGEIQLFDAYGASASVSPIDQSILFTREGMSWARKGYTGSRAGQIWLWNNDEKDYRRLFADNEFDVRYPIWNRDGKSFYFVSEEDGTKNLWSYDLKTTKRKQLTDFEDDGIISPALSADGQTIVFRRLFDLYRFNPTRNKPPAKIELTYEGDLFDTVELERKLTEATNASFNENGNTFAFVAGGDVWVSDTTLKEPVQITTTASYESEVLFDHKNDRIIYVGSENDQVDIYSVKRADTSKPWWRNRTFDTQRLTEDEFVEESLEISPKGTYLTFVRHRDGLYTLNLTVPNSPPDRLVKTWSGIGYDWSPDENWLTYSAADNNFNYDIHVINVEEPDESYNISKHPDNEYNPTWAPDGKTIAFVGRRFDQEYDIYYVPLLKSLAQRSARDVKLETALKNSENDEPTQEEAKGDDASAALVTTPEEKPDFEFASQRIRKVNIPNATEQQLTWSPDSKLLAFQTTIDGKSGLYAITPYMSTTPKLLLSDPGRLLEWRADNKRIYWIKNGVPGWTTSNGSASANYSFTARQIYDLGEYHREIYLECWRIMRDDFYDGNFNNRNWDEIRRKYEVVAAETYSKDNLLRIMSLMLGELNASHLGYRGPTDPKPQLASRNITGHLGVLWDPNHQGPGMRVLEVIKNSPASYIKSQLNRGDIILAINGVNIDPALDLTKVLNGTVSQETLLTIKADKENTELTIIPISYSSFRSLLYERWLASNRAMVEKKSKGKFGYLHIRAMDMTSFHKFERELYEVAAGKDGIVIDVRENGGGFTTDHLLTILTQPRHAITKPRGGGMGYPQDRSIYATWSKPIVVLCNQNSHSNAEIFSHAIKHLRRGQVVGVPTSGSVISTGSRAVLDAGTIRIPFRGWYLLNNGEDMELNGAIPHHILWPQPGQLPQGIDIQLDKAIAVLRKDVAKFKRNEVPALIKASERLKPENN